MHTPAETPSAAPSQSASLPTRSQGPSPLLFVPVGADRSPCDLLYGEPLGRLELAPALEALTFAFASGDGDVFTRLLDHTPTAPSSFALDDFARDLQLERFVERCWPVVARGHRRSGNPRHLLRVLGAPPRERSHVEFRQRICAELASSPPLAARLEELYVRLCSFRDRISRPSIGVQGGIERRLGILASVRAVFESLASDFAGTTSGLERLHAFGAHVTESAAYRRLCQLCDYERQRAQVDLRVGIGFDGRIRSLETLEQREPRSNPFYQSALGRLWTQLGLLLRGHRASTGEILSRLVDGVFADLERYVIYLFQLIGDIEVYLGALGFRRLAAQGGLEVCLPELRDHGTRRLIGLFNPWLVAEGRACVPANLELSEHLVMITGPNSGGKTRLLQALCLCQLLGQGGFFVPAAQAELRWCSGLFASLIEHAQADPVEGRLGTELMRIRHAFERLRLGSMVVMDELCSGTNPSEGEALMQLVLDALCELAPQAFITTHFLGFAARLAQSSPRHRFLQAELDPYERPTYHFVEGVAATSLAHRVAERLGVTRESLAALMRANNPELCARPGLTPPSLSPPAPPSPAPLRLPFPRRELSGFGNG